MSSLSATVTSKSNIEGRIFCTYPGFLRRTSAWVKKSVVDRLSDTCGCSKKAVREELLPSLIAVQSKNKTDFTISLSLGLSPEEHAAICGLKLTHRSTKELMEEYSTAQIEFVENTISVNSKNDVDEYIEQDIEIESDDSEDNEEDSE